MDSVRAMSDAQSAALRSGTIPEPEEVRPGIHAIALPMPGMQPPYAFCYALLAGGGARAVHMVDAGLDTEENWEVLRRALAGLGRDLTDIASVTLTHLHYDHTGLAARMREASGAVVRMHRTEAAAMRDGARFSAGSDVRAALEEWGVPEDSREEIRAIAGARADFGATVTVDEEVTGGELLDLGGHRVRVLHTPGHTAGHICLVLEGGRAVFTGDHVLPLINPGIALGGKPAQDPLGEYYASLDLLAPYADAEGLPGHGFRFSPLGARCAEIRAHHEARTQRAAQQLGDDPGLSVWELASRLQWTGGWEALSPVSRVSALAQTAMHVARLTGAGRNTTRGGLG